MPPVGRLRNGATVKSSAGIRSDPAAVKRAAEQIRARRQTPLSTTGTAHQGPREKPPKSPGTKKPGSEMEIDRDNAGSMTASRERIKRAPDWRANRYVRRLASNI